MKVFSSWSGGKDCMLALYRTRLDGEHDVACLVNMCDRYTAYSRSHGQKKELLARQATAMNIRLLQKETTRREYEQDFKSVMRELKSEGFEGGVFGDIYLREHRVWIERVCQEAGIEPIFPLWDNSTTELASEFIASGFKTLLVSVHSRYLPEEFIGKLYDQELVARLVSMPGIDVCAENGEFHTFVFDGPLFTRPVELQKGAVTFYDEHWFLELN